MRQGKERKGEQRKGKHGDTEIKEERREQTRADMDFRGKNMGEHGRGIRERLDDKREGNIRKKDG